MSPAYASSQVLELLGSLAEIPGTAAIELRARRFSRLMPTQQAQYYQEVRASFPAGQLPDRISIPLNPDEIDVTVHGLLPADAEPQRVLGQVEDFVHGHLGREWDLRVDLPAAESRERDFHLNVFLNHAPPRPVHHEPAD